MRILLSLLNKSIQDRLDHDASKEPKDPFAERILRFASILWIDLFSKETQNPFSVSFGLKNQILNFLKEMHPKYLSKRLMELSRLESKKCSQVKDLG